MKKIKFYPFNESASKDMDRPLPASKHIPEWYRKQPGSMDDDAHVMSGVLGSTVKRCMPIFDAITAGYIFVAPCDIYIDATDPEKLQKSIPAAMKLSQGDIFATHAPDQYSHFPIDFSIYHKELLRINVYWSAQTSDGTSSIIMQPIHQEVSPLMAIAGIIDTDKMITDGHFSFLVKKDFKGIIKQGTPLAQVIPFVRDSWESEVVDYETSMNTIRHQRFILRRVFNNGYKNLMRSKKDYK